MPKGVIIIFAFFVVIVSIVIGVIVHAIVRETVFAWVISKCIEIVRCGGEEPDRIAYYVTFRSSDGEVQEFLVSDSEYRLLVEGDQGVLSRRGALYKGFQRQGSAVAR